MNPSLAYDPGLHEPGSVAASGRCSYHEVVEPGRGSCTGEAVVSFQARGEWHSGCSAALERLVEEGEIEPLGQGA